MKCITLQLGFIDEVDEDELLVVFHLTLNLCSKSGQPCCLTLKAYKNWFLVDVAEPMYV